MSEKVEKHLTQAAASAKLAGLEIAKITGHGATFRAERLREANGLVTDAMHLLSEAMDIVRHG